MPEHLTVRMAWHDNKWDGKVCLDPEGNAYCVGTHSLLTARLTRNKNAKLESPGAKLDANKDYLPPCFWSSNAFGPTVLKINHPHPFSQYENKVIADKLLPSSVFSWPFRLSFNHDKKKRDREGSYPEDLTDRISNFTAKFSPGKSIVFYYLNYSNPVSADDHKYALVGCGVLNSPVEMPADFSFSPAELQKLRSPPKMKNCPVINWAIQFNTDPSKSVRLPYQEYLEYIAKNPNDEKLLDEMKSLVEEAGLVSSFKYVAETLNDDKCIYLLCKLRKAFLKVKEHGIVPVDKEMAVIEELIAQAWRARSLYPGLANVLDLIAELGDEGEHTDGLQIVSEIRGHTKDERQVLDTLFSMLKDDNPIPDYLSSYEGTIEAAKLGFSNNQSLAPALKKFSLFNLTKKQINRIIFPTKKDRPFGNQSIRLDDLTNNPYLLCEEYCEGFVNLDEPEPADEPIGIFNVDIGMFPDVRYLTRRSDLQNLTSSSPERLRAVIVEHLFQLEAQGHCFDTLDRIHEAILDHPLFYREKLNLNPGQLISEKYVTHFRERLDVVENQNGTFLYLKEIRFAEKFIQDLITKLMTRRDHNVKLDWVDDYLEQEAKKLAVKVPSFDKPRFVAERKKLITGALTQSFYVVTGKPGSGKTIALKKVIDTLVSSGEDVTLLTPTGKASLRAKEATEHETQTIDRLIYSERFSSCLDDLRSLETQSSVAVKPTIENLVVDESSMVDLRKLATLFGMLTTQGGDAVKRVILVGDENQLPPIGFGKPFYDIVEHLKKDKSTREKHLVRLETNCRQKFDADVIRIADVFSGTNRYYSEMFEKLQSGGHVSPGLHVSFWNDRDELQDAMRARLTEVLKEECVGASGDVSESFNLLMGLFENGYLRGNDPDNLKLDAFQIITPYNAGFYGSIGINDFIRSEYKKDFWPAPDPDANFKSSSFGHSEKIIRTQNWYWWEGSPAEKVLALSNGSIGIVCNNKQGRNLYFPDRDSGIPDWRVDDGDSFELAYAITVHKSQGSEFKHTFVVIPERKALLFRELVYTALTRSSHKVHLFVQKTDDPEGPLGFARQRSAILSRNTSLFQEPMDAKRVLEPEPGKLVKSKVEYIIYRTLMDFRNKGQLNFDYEKQRTLKQLSYPIKPDFSVYVGDRVYYWEHLGMLDLRDYSKNWKERKQAYSAEGLGNNLVTTDDMSGLTQEIVQKVVEDMLTGNVKGSKDAALSDHHYRLYPD